MESLQLYLNRLNVILGRRFSKLSAAQQEIAAFGIRRHILACSRLECGVDWLAVAEILDDAKSNRSVARENVSEVSAAESNNISPLMWGEQPGYSGMARMKSKARL